MNIAELVKLRRKDLGMTQKEAAMLAGVSPRFWFDVEDGKGTVSLQHLLAALDALGLEMKIELIDPKNEPV